MWSILFKGPGRTAQKTLNSSVIKAGLCGLYRENFDVFSDRRKKRYKCSVGRIFFVSQNIAICPKTFSNRVWQSLLTACRRYIQWYSSSFSAHSQLIGLVSSYMIYWITHNDAPQSVGLLWTSDQSVSTHNTRNRKTSIPSVGFEPTISAGERPQTYALDRAATGTGCGKNVEFLYVTTSGIYSNR
jgi:hypothetical protein